jgi:acyl carrier protein
MDPKLTEVFRDVFDEPELQLRDDLARDNYAAWDSFAHVKLILALEEEFNVKFTIDQVTNIRSVAEVRSVLGRLGA